MVSEGGEPFGADHEDRLGTPCLDLSGGHRERLDEAGAGGVDVERARLERADPVSHQRRECRCESVVAHRGHQDLVDLGRLHAGIGQGALRRIGSQ